MNIENRPTKIQYQTILSGLILSSIVSSIVWLFSASINTQKSIAVIEKECEINHEEIDRCRNAIHKQQGE